MSSRSMAMLLTGRSKSRGRLSMTRICRYRHRILLKGPPFPIRRHRKKDAGSIPTPLLDCRQEWFTEFGGLLFLAPQMKRLGIIDTIQTDPLFKERPLRWALHCLSLELVPADAHDPGVLAFCGLQPDKPPPGKDEPAMGRAEARRFEQWRERLVAVLCDDLGWRQMSDAHLLQRLCGRKARIVAEPGWIEVFLALADVCLDIRRAGLDLDPGFIPWLGVVIKFHYA